MVVQISKGSDPWRPYREHAEQIRANRPDPIDELVDIVVNGAAAIDDPDWYIPRLPRNSDDAVLQAMYPSEDPHASDPAGWFSDVLGEFAWSKQREVATSVAQHRYTACQACHGVGKSWLAARLIAWWLAIHPAGEAQVVWTAPRWKQVNSIIGRELRAVARQHPELDMRVTQDSQVYIRGIEGGFGRKPADKDEHGFQGIHARYVLIVIDEACGVTDEIWKAVKTLATNEHARVLAIGNPDDPQTEFAKICKPGSGWNRIRIDALHTPNFTAAAVAEHPVIEELMDREGIAPSSEPIPDILREYLVTPEWVEERSRDYGIGSFAWTSKIRGEFPEVSSDTLFPPSLIRQAQDLDLGSNAIKARGVMAFDISRFGGDETVGYWNRAGYVRRIYSARHQDTMQTANDIHAIVGIEHLGRIPAWVDVIGLGAGVYDRLAELEDPVLPFNASERAYNPDRFVNRRAEAYWVARERLLEKGVDLDEDDDILIAQLGNIRWKIVNGRIQIESKDDMKKRGLPSPDRADAFVVSLEDPDVYVTMTETPLAPGLTAGLLSREL